MDRREEKYIKKFLLGNLKGQDDLEDLGIDMWIISE
jgi:hypothetical protein